MLPPGLDKPSVLEIGPGTGALTAVFEPLISERRGRYEAIELSPDMAAQCRQRVWNAEVVVADWRDVLNGQRQWDVIVARMVLRHEPNWNDALNRWAKHVTRGGILVIAEGPPPSNDPEVVQFYRDVMTEKHGSTRHAVLSQDVSARLLDSGFGDVATFDRFSFRNSLNNWLVGGCVPEERASRVRYAHVTASDVVRSAYDMMATDTFGVLMTWKHSVIVGRRNP